MRDLPTWVLAFGHARSRFLLAATSLLSQLIPPNRLPILISHGRRKLLKDWGVSLQ